jgi:3-methylcrotonyl-CoA carboxylase alpha subunit
MAIRKLRDALQQYEVVGLSTNIEFLKKVCQSPAFIRGDVETGYIKKYNDELFSEEPIEVETLAQAALGLVMKGAASNGTIPHKGPHGETVGFASSHERQFYFRKSPSDAESELIAVAINQTGRNAFNVAIIGSEIETQFEHVLCEVQDSFIITVFPHTRIETTMIVNGDKLTLFQRGKQTQLTLASPTWYEKALGIKEVTNSVLAPMPCKVLRNEVNEGDVVEKDQALVV